MQVLPTYFFTHRDPYMQLSMHTAIHACNNTRSHPCTQPYVHAAIHTHSHTHASACRVAWMDVYYMNQANIWITDQFWIHKLSKSIFRTKLRLLCWALQYCHWPYSVLDNHGGCQKKQQSMDRGRFLRFFISSCHFVSWTNFSNNSRRLTKLKKYLY